MRIRDKVNHVKQAKQTRTHQCHWPGCNKQESHQPCGDGNSTAMLGGELCEILSYLCMLATKAGVDLQSSAGIKFNEVTKRPERKFKDIIIPEEEFL